MVKLFVILLHLEVKSGQRGGFKRTVVIRRAYKGCTKVKKVESESNEYIYDEFDVEEEEEEDSSYTDDE